MFLVLSVLFYLFKFLYKKIVCNFARLDFWKNDFFVSLNELYLIASFSFLVFFSKNELLSLLIFVLVIFFLFWRLEFHLKKHPTAFAWLSVNRAVFFFVLFLFILNSFFQYIAYYYYILDENIKYFNIVLFRSWSITSFWILGFAISSLFYFKLKSKLRYLLFSFWVAFLFFNMFLLAVNAGVLYWTGFYFNPIIFSHVGEGVGQVFWNNITYFLFVLFLIVSVLLIFVFKFLFRVHHISFQRPLNYYNFILMAICLISLVGLSSFRNTPEFLISKSFIKYFSNTIKGVELSVDVEDKLKNYGLFYNTNNYKLIDRDKVFYESDLYLPERFKEKKPNIVIVFFESFSSRLTSVYNQEFLGVTPRLQDFSNNSNTTIFKNFYNASTPTITGLISSLCSFYPPTGHEAIEKQSQFRKHNLLCLPEMLKKYGDYQDIVYITAVKKNFAHKDTIISSMGVDKIYGQEELSKLTKEEPLSWGYSDHQLYPLMEDLFKNSKEPWLYMLSTVDNHPPYNLAKDEVLWEDGNNLVLNSVHTSDSAFGKFWDRFKNSNYYQNTIVIAVADHAIFPQALNNKYFSDKHKGLLPYDEIMFMIYMPENILPKEIDVLSSGVDFAPTILNILNINEPNSFEGWSILSERKKYPNILGMHEVGLYINENNVLNDYADPYFIDCKKENFINKTNLTLCELKHFFEWKKEMLLEGRFWKN